jgi:hypothetical protein
MSIAGGILSAIGAAGALFAGYGSVTLGPVQFSGLGKPKSMPIGGKQQLVNHKLPGGGRQINAMGPDDNDISWSGYLDGQSASANARALDRLRQSGQAVTLAWDVFSYQVLVSDFTCETQHIPMPYRVTCTVISDNSQTTGTSLTSLALQVVADVQDGNPIAALGAVSQGTIGNTLGVAATAVGAPGATTLASSAYNTAVGAVNTAATAISTATKTVNATLAPLGVSLASLSAAAPAALDVVGMSGKITQAAAACGDLAQLTASAAYIGRASANLQRASA